MGFKTAQLGFSEIGENVCLWCQVNELIKTIKFTRKISTHKKNQYTHTHIIIYKKWNLFNKILNSEFTLDMFNYLFGYWMQFMWLYYYNIYRFLWKWIFITFFSQPTCTYPIFFSKKSWKTTNKKKWPYEHFINMSKYN